MLTLQEIFELQLLNPESFQAGFVFAAITFIFVLLWIAVLEIVTAFIWYIDEKTRAIKIENDKKSPPKKLANLFKKKERIKNGQDTDII